MDNIRITIETPKEIKKLPSWIRSWFKIQDHIVITLGATQVKDILLQIARQVPQPLRGLLEAAIAGIGT